MNSKQKIWTRLLLAVLLVGATSSNVVDARSGTKATLDPAEQNMKDGLLQIRKGNYEAAIDCFKQAGYFSRANYNPDAYKYLGLCYKAVRDYPHAIEAFNRFFQQTTVKNGEMHIEAGECYLNMQEWDKAKKEIQLAGQDGDARKMGWRYKYAMGEFHEKYTDAGQDSNYATASDFYEAAIELAPHSTEAWMAKARAELKLKNYNDALRIYRTILEKGPILHPDLEELYYNMGTCLLVRGDHQGALDHWRLALERNPDSFNTHLALANLLDKEQHLSSALNEYRAATRSAPKDSPAMPQIMRRMQWIEQQLQPQEAPVRIKPSPVMRQQLEEEKIRQQMEQAPPPSKESGF